MHGVPVRHETIPVPHGGRVIAVVERSTNLSSARTPSRMELTYLKGGGRSGPDGRVGMFPRPGEAPALVRSPRVGDGLLRLGRSGKVIYASPNALSAYRRLGLTADLVGAELGPLTARLCARGQPRDDSLMVTASGRAPRETEIEGNGSVVQLRAIPLVVAGRGRRAGPPPRRDRTAAPRARADHQGRHDQGDPPPGEEQPPDGGRAPPPSGTAHAASPEARAALEEAVRRVGSIALVHETLSHAPEEIVEFDDIAGRVATMAGEVSARRGAGWSRSLTGRFGMLSGAVATPLALVLTELLQNALQHGLSRLPGRRAGRDAGGHRRRRARTS